MNIAETTTVMAVLKEAYPSFYAGRSEEDIMPAIRLWQECFAEDEYTAVMAAVKALIVSRVEGYPPTIGAVKEKLRMITAPASLNEQEAWNLVRKAISDGIYHYQEQYAKLPPEVQEAVGEPSQLRAWAVMDESTVQSVVASNFMRAFRAKEKRREEYEALPLETRRTMIELTKSFALPSRKEALSGV